MIRNSMFKVVFCVWFGLGSMAALAAGGPQWWTDREVFTSEPVQDHASANQGQVMFIASKAAEEFHDKLAMFDLSEIDSLVSDFNDPEIYHPDNFSSVVNMGQLKYIAKPFYDVLSNSTLRAAWPSEMIEGPYPWSDFVGTEQDYASANLGQLKYVFSFDLSDIVHVRNIILCIGDGMGPEQVKAARYYAGTDLFFESFPYQSTMTTWSADNPITDSAASATAMATGIKVNNRVVSLQLPGDGSELETLLEYFKQRDKSTGLVATSMITHATPAAFGAHETSRQNYANIATDYLTQTKPNVLFGGGGYGMTESAALAAGYTVVANTNELSALDTETATYVSGQFGSGYMPYENDGLGNLPHLHEMTQAALNILDNDSDGFFLMIEASRIDHAGHANNVTNVVHETLEYAESVKAAFNWMAGRTDTLLIVTADHETGGLTVTTDNGAGNYPDVTWSTKGHTSTDVSVYGTGVNAHYVTNVTDNTDIHTVLVSP